MTSYRFKNNFLHKTDKILISAKKEEALFKIPQNYSHMWRIGELCACYSRKWDEMSGIRWDTDFEVAIRMIKYGKDYSILSLRKWK